jgi:SNF2 family DNA or RNA helicase
LQADEKVLVFSQFTESLDIVEVVLDAHGCGYM